MDSSGEQGPRSRRRVFSRFNKFLLLDCMLTSQSETGKKISNYIYYYHDTIGRGNFARVYRSTNIITKEVVAIKAISLDELKSKRLESLVFEEIRILQAMSHPNVLKFHEALLSDRNCYIVTELCLGGNLDERIKRGPPMTNTEIAGILLQLIEGLKYLRKMQVVHRDLKPANIFFGERIKIADFGLARFYSERFKDLDIGSPQYMSPQGLLLNVYSQKTDIWALGIMVYEMFHGRTPFQYCRDERELKNMIVRPLPETMFRKDLLPCFRQLINRMLEVDERLRPSIYDLSKEPAFAVIEELAVKGKQDKVKINKLESDLQPIFGKKNLFSPSKKPQKQRFDLRQLNSSLQPTQSSGLQPNISFNFPKQRQSQQKQELKPKIDVRHNKSFTSDSFSNFWKPPPTTKHQQQQSTLWSGQNSSKTNQTWCSEEQSRRFATDRSFHQYH